MHGHEGYGAVLSLLPFFHVYSKPVAEVKPLLKKAGIEVAFRGQNKANPQAPGQLSDWYPIENVNGWVKDKILVALNNSPKWRHGASPRWERAGTGRGLEVFQRVGECLDVRGAQMGNVNLDGAQRGNGESR